ncbi:MAG TPA: site-specific DNA-methyltransferase, partial [Alphaproteobacteria bacterium]
GAVAKKLGRNYIGLERDENYIEVAEKRIKSITKLGADEILHAPSKREEPRIPFGQLIENGLLKPGTTLTDAKQRYVAKVSADGNLISNQYRGSIHKVGAALQGAPSCNGWTYWHIKQGKDVVPIDTLRQKLRGRNTETLQ